MAFSPQMCEVKLLIVVKHPRDAFFSRPEGVPIFNRLAAVSRLRVREEQSAFICGIRDVVLSF